MDLSHEKTGPSGIQEEKRKDFLRFLSAYPKKPTHIQLPYVELQWGAISPSAEEVDAMLDQIAEETRSENWKKNGGQFIPSAENWLKKWRYTQHDIKQKCEINKWDEMAYYAFLRSAKAMGMEGAEAEDYAKWACGVMNRIPSYGRRGSS